MYRAISLVELLTILAVMAISLLFFSPVLFQIQSPIVLANEVDQIKSFIYQVQTTARYQQTAFSVSFNQQHHNWCMVAVEKIGSKQTACDCFNVKRCAKNTRYFLYESKVPSLVLVSKKKFPAVFMNVDGTTGKIESICLGLRIKDVQQTVQFNENGVISVAQKGKRTQCR